MSRAQVVTGEPATDELLVQVLYTVVPPQAEELFAQLDAELARRYAERPRPQLAELARAAVRRIRHLGRRSAPRRRRALLLAMIGGTAVGCAALFEDGRHSVELGRMYVMPAHRGQGIADALLVRAEATAHALGSDRIRLETGTRQPEAVAVYTRHGYLPTRRWGSYRGNLDSRCYEKRLDARPYA